MKYLLALYILAIPLACSNDSGNESYAVSEMDAVALDMEVAESFKVQPQSDDAEVQEQKLIKESFLSFETQDLEESHKAVVSAISSNKGYIQDDSSNKGYNRVSRRIVARIPTTNFESTIDAIDDNVEYFDSKRITSRDVTEEFIDLEARLKAKRTLEERYLQLLSKAKNVKEILEIERELSSIREDIEAKQGRLNYLQNKVSLSTLTIEFYKVTTETGVTQSYGSKMWKAISSGFDGISMFFLGILYIWPFILLLILGAWLLRRWLKKRNKS
ncbi:DUF4349 domain-containing protein [Winogradskyella maritima]|uniref:DUF4349 domain-containing protein n=1 Tax=Winogradskyella maritima TaxID=1517766 RepID=A0ABV8AH85_9FLAO|nr:DUF4349 domain-containing protein [Winogradskyella maritima]